MQKIPGRRFLNGASSVASLFTQQGRKGTNQDAMIVWENFCSRTDTIFCGVFDGHGPFGHMVARRVRDSLPLKLSAHLESNSRNHYFVSENSISTIGNLTSEETLSICLDEESRNSADLDEDRDPDLFSILKESFLKAFKVMDKELKLHPNIDCFCSGTTAVTLIKQGQDLVIGNVGDSRAVLGTRDQNDCLIAVQLTVDLKPNLPKEEERIKQCRGRVFALRDEPDVARVWLPHNDSPGLAMARALGDFCLKDYGLISVPEVSYRRLTEKDEFIVLATDGVWDVLSNKEVVDIVASASSRSSAARSLVESAVHCWRHKYPTSKIDDCAVVCLFLTNNSEFNAASASANDISSSIANNENHVEDASINNSKKIPENLVEDSKRTGKGKGEKEFLKDQLMEGDEWSALEGVSRVNTMLTLPRFNTAAGKSKSKKSV
ncbi:uncharacterized protein A4U43_C02F14260 [Asparagus officinalis]|uniref:protein-serine/threonine phosphatase n=1 Tax=Asparagus officinalis TaxID=4686 RepID=A0A5P1FI75_ASPOF|nr:probable protein phosphatase 2C 33 [Asparagus officinalis]ONK78095.1 uncharacterized protein A4U43_C02F14260 [Asparagus officinalis]